MREGEKHVRVSESEWPINLFTHMCVCGAYTRVRERELKTGLHINASRGRGVPAVLAVRRAQKLSMLQQTNPCHVHQMNVM